MGFEQRRTADGYMLRVMPDYYEEDQTVISVYPPESDGIDKDDRVAELLFWNEDTDIVMQLLGNPVIEREAR